MCSDRAQVTYSRSRIERTSRFIMMSDIVSPPFVMRVVTCV